MTKVLVSKFRNFLILGMFVLAAGALSLTASPPAYAAGFVDDVAGKTTIKLKDIPGVGKLLADLKLNKLANTDMASVTATEKTISGFVNFFAMRWNFLVFKGGTGTYFALEPVSATGKPRTPKLSDFFKAPGIEVTDMLTFDRMVWVIAAKGSELDQDKLPPAAKAMFSPYFDDNAAFEVSIDQGLTFLAMSDIGKLKPLKDALDAIGGKSSKALFKSQLSTGILSSVMDGKPAPQKKPSSGGFAGLAAMKKINAQMAAQVQEAMKQSATAVAAANAARSLQKKQADARKKRQAEIKKKRLLAFTAKLKKREASIKKRTARTAKLREARKKIVAKKTVAKSKKVVAASKLAAAKAQKAGKAKKAKSKALAKLNQKQRQAFARSYSKKVSAKKRPAVRTTISKERLAKRQARMAKRLAKVGKMNAGQKKAFAVAYAKARARTRASMLKTMPVSRASTIQTKPKGKVAAPPPDRASVNTKMLKQLRTLKALAR
jgi:hypothetical protein